MARCYSKSSSSFEGIDQTKHDAKERNEPQPDFKMTLQFMEEYDKTKSPVFLFEQKVSSTFHNYGKYYE